MTRRVTFLAVAVIVAAIAFGLAWPRIDHDRIESINSPVSVHGWDEAGLLLADGRHIQLPEFVRLPIQSAALSEATKRGVEFGADGRIYGLVRVHHWCGNDPVREHIAKVDLSHMLTFIRERERTTPPSDPDVLARESDGWFSEWGWDVGKFYQYQMYSKHFIGEPDSAPNGSQPIRADTNQTRSTAGSRR